MTNHIAGRRDKLECLGCILMSNGSGYYHYHYFVSLSIHHTCKVRSSCLECNIYVKLHFCTSTPVCCKSADTSSRCCRSRMHVMCIRRITVCPGCGEGWTPLPCCQCSKRMSYSKDLVEQTACCDADIHEHCLYRLKSKPCRHLVDVHWTLRDIPILLAPFRNTLN